MGMLHLLLGKKSEPSGGRNSRTPQPNSTQFVASQLSPGSSVNSVRKDLLRVVLREMLTRNGIPLGWLGADMVRSTSSKREPGLHVRFLVRVWEPRLMLHGPALEQEFQQRLVVLDPQAEDWLMGFSWQFTLPDASVCPPLPHPGSWTAPRTEDVPQNSVQYTKPGDIIEGPVVIKPADEVKADLERLLALRDDDLKRHAQSGDTNFAPTRPASF